MEEWAVFLARKIIKKVEEEIEEFVGGGWSSFSTVGLMEEHREFLRFNKLVWEKVIEEARKILEEIEEELGG